MAEVINKFGFTTFQIVRLAFGIGILAIIIVIYFPYLFFTYSSNAVVSARIITLTTPIDGIVSKAPPMAGTELHQGDVIAEFINTTVDRSTVGQLQVEKTSLEERVESLIKEKESLLKLKTELDESKKNFLASREERINYDIKRSEKRHQELIASVNENQRLLTRKKELNKKGVLSTSSLDETFFLADRSTKAADQAKLEMERLIVELNDVKKGIFINQDGRSEVTYQDQRIDEIYIRITDIDSRINEYKARITALNERLRIEKDRLSGLEKSDIRAPEFSVVLRSHVLQGTHIDEKTKVVDIIDCSKVFIDMTIHEGYFEKIKMGERVTVKLRGGLKPIHGKVSSVRGGAVFAEPEKAIAGVVPIRRPHEMQVIIEIDKEDLYESASDFCHVGRSGEVSFDKIKT